MKHVKDWLRSNTTILLINATHENNAMQRNFFLFHLTITVQNLGFVRHHGFQTLLRPPALICFEVFGTHDEALARVFGILIESVSTKKKEIHIPDSNQGLSYRLISFHA